MNLCIFFFLAYGEDSEIVSEKEVVKQELFTDFSTAILIKNMCSCLQCLLQNVKKACILLIFFFFKKYIKSSDVKTLRCWVRAVY